MRILQTIGALFILVASPAVSKEVAASWIVTQKSGDVRVLRNGVQPASIQLRSALSPGDVIATGANGRAMLTKGDDYVVVAPASRLMLPKEQQQSGFTRLFQQMGTMLYKVKRTGAPHFAVETPMLAAVVKGTTFTVVVDDKRAAVQVTEGIVEVSSASGDARRLVEGGMTVYIGRERPNVIVDVKSSADLPRSTGESGEAVKIEGSGDVSLSTIANLTDGLVSAPPVAPVVAVADTAATNLVPASASLTTGLTGPVLSDATAPVTDVIEPLPSAVDTVVDVVDTTVPSVTDPVIDFADSALPAATDPVIDIVDTVLPSAADPVVDIVDAVLPAVTEPVVDIVDAVLPSVTEPVVEIVDAALPSVTEPVVEIVDAVLPSVTEPVVEIIDTTLPAVTEPVVEIVDATLPAVTEPVVEIVESTLPAVTEPVVEVVAVIPEVVCILLCPR